MGHAFQSPLRRWEVLAGLCQQMKARTFVEVGCKEGHTTGFLLANCPELQVVAIDPWAPIVNADEDYSGWDFAKIEAEFWQNVGRGPDATLLMLKMMSLEAADMLKKSQRPGHSLATGFERFSEGIDIVFIDAGHDYENARADIQAWWPLVREGGYLCGHDYQHKFPGVMRAVAAAFPLLRVAVCPDSMWVVQKESDLKLREVA